MGNPYMTAPFKQQGASLAISATTTHSVTALPVAARDRNCIVSNPSANVCFVAFGGASAEASPTLGAAVLAGHSRIFSILAAETHISVELDTGTGTIYVSCGDGI